MAKSAKPSCVRCILLRCPRRRRSTGLSHYGVAFVGSYFPLDMKHINSQFIHVSANALMQLFVILIVLTSTYFEI